MTFRFSRRSFDRLAGVNPRLVCLFGSAILRSPVDFMIVEGLRTPERQRELLARGATTTLRSRHIHGFAVDAAPIVGGVIPWGDDHDDAPWLDLAAHVKALAADHGIPVEWGGDWKSFIDMPHWQLPSRQFPDTAGKETTWQP